MKNSKKELWEHVNRTPNNYQIIADLKRKIYCEKNEEHRYKKAPDNNLQVLHDYAGTLNIFDRRRLKPFEKYFAHDELMLSIYKQVKSPDEYPILGPALFGFSKFEVLPFVYYSIYKAKASYMKRLPKIVKEWDLQVNDRINDRNNLEWQKEEIIQSEEYKNDDPTALEKVEKIKSEIDAVNDKISDNTNRRLKKSENRPEEEIEDFVLKDGKPNQIILDYKRQNYDSLLALKTNLKSKLKNTNKKIYLSVFRYTCNESFSACKGLLSWVVSSQYRRRRYLYDLDPVLISYIDGFDQDTLSEHAIQNLNELRQTGAQLYFKIALLNYIIRCQEDGISKGITIKDFHNKLEEQKNSDQINDPKASISSNDIWKNYWDLKNAGKKRNYAFEKVSQWLLDELKFTKKEIKDRFNITLTMENFCRSATNNKP